MAGIFTSFFNMIERLKAIIDFRLRVYCYKDFVFYSQTAKNDFADTLAPLSLQQIKDSTTTEYSHVDSHQVKHLLVSSESFANPNLSLFQRLKDISDSPSFYQNSFENGSSKKSHFLYKKFWNLFNPFQTQICVLSPDFIEIADIMLKKNEIVENGLMDRLALLKARQFNLIPHDCECLYSIKNMDSEHISFYLFSAIKSKLSWLLIHSKQLCCLNPFYIFTSLYLLYPNLTHYTIVFQDKDSHALCHYSYGNLDFVVITQRQIALQNYYTQIEILGEMLYCDWSGEREYLRDFIPIESLFNAPLDTCLKILAISHIYTKPINTNFCSNEFYMLRNKIQWLLLSSCLILGFFIGSFFYQKYQYYKFITSQNKEYMLIISKQFDKKQTYTPMYYRIYSHLLRDKNLKFHIKQEYRNATNSDKKKWIQVIP